MDCIYIKNKQSFSGRDFTRCFGGPFEALSCTDGTGMYIAKCMCCNKTNIKHKFDVETTEYQRPITENIKLGIKTQHRPRNSIPKS